MHFLFFVYFTNPICVFCLLSFNLDINASFNFNEKSVLFMKFLNDEKNSFSTRKCHISTTTFSELNWIGFKARTIAASATYSASLKWLFIL